ncbi:MAG: TIM barrel protein [Candidatus Borkfalkiaceae bacterium]|nr:TIM barrel protein [Clostridia bacterium]MDY6222765.1 TIM barrel protein [Christensenellaceae bacterium]
MFQTGLVSVSFRNSSAEEIVEAAKAANLTHIQWGSDVHAPRADFSALQRISALCAANGITCSYGTYFRFGQNSLEELHAYLHAAKMLNAGILRVWCGTKNSDEYTLSELNAVYEDCKKAAAIAEKEGVVLGLECHHHTLTASKENALALMQINSPAFRMFWQPNQYKSTAENLEYAKLLAPYTVCIHAFHWENDNKYSLATAEDTWRKYLKFFSPDIPVLLEFMPDDDIRSLPAESAALRRIIKTAQN